MIEVAGCGVCHTDISFLHQGVPTRAPLPQQLLVKHSDFPLNRIKDMALEWETTGDPLVHPRLLISPAQLAAFRARRITYALGVPKPLARQFATTLQKLAQVFLPLRLRVDAIVLRRPLPVVLAQRVAFEQLGDGVVDSIGGAHIVDVEQIRVRQRGQRLGLPGFLERLLRIAG